MTGRRFRWLGFGLLASASAGLLTWASMMTSAFAYGDDTALIMGPSGIPIPPPDYVDAVDKLYIAPLHSGFTPQALFTPEGLYPLTGVKTLPVDTSIAQGVTILNNAITTQVGEGNDVVAFGYSQSSTISSLEMRDLAALPPDERPTPDQLAFVLVGDPSNPNGGVLERFDGLSLSSLGQTFSGATPDDVYPTTIYTGEYDGFADFPQYPINLPADLNAVLGILFVHGEYPFLTPEQVTPEADGGAAIQLQTVGDTMTNYFIIPTENLPLLDPLRLIPVVGNPLADLIQPDLTAIVNVGYGDPDFGYSTGPANVPTPFGLFPPLSDFEKLLPLLVTGTEMGIKDFIGDLSHLSLMSSPLPPSIFPDPFAPLSAAAPSGTSLTDIANTLSAAAATAYATLLPTADTLNALVTSLPAYDVSLFLDNLSNPLDAIGLPIAADAGLATLAAGFEAYVLAEAADSVVSDLMSLIP